MPGLTKKNVSFFQHSEYINLLFGFLYCSIETPLNGYLGLLAVTTSQGFNFSLGQWKGLYFSKQLKCAKEHGYKIKVLKDYIFDRVNDVFIDYVSKVYPIKWNTTNKN